MHDDAVVYQKIGALQPFNWTAAIKGHIQGGEVSGGILGDRIKDHVKDQIPTDHDIEATKGSKG